MNREQTRNVQGGNNALPMSIVHYPPRFHPNPHDSRYRRLTLIMINKLLVIMVRDTHVTIETP